ncbi:hypothetical protein VOLCADRAFT_99048 [Volvox carteri f. nagariensis]|uniref:Uncharacterized protein n=1 Tax=Volvox carteri f. nagariensis TaxID=3068 RepID=D8UGX3_VOLCA|nr:uncharacterized protein VOLCADRAFT_99048 [Volvox carteri f. nagariensis]EFJ41054.1 hypothetical protein VOLCADRAFT_99048 [Volvox carteri f. nagariensis]|eukprot:XP_002957918.1 hypothetical protein VOLCADRAFT_99048 [Volvox carteri f. nagariensis]
MCSGTVSAVSGIKNALHLAQNWLRAIEGDAERKADPTRRTALDVLVAVLALLAATASVLGSIAFGWWVLWCTSLHTIGMFRDLMGLNRAAKADAKRRAHAEIQALKVSQLSQQHGFGSKARPPLPCTRYITGHLEN